MNIAAVLIDVSNTTVQDGMIVDGIIELTQELRKRGIKPYFVANDTWRSKKDLVVIDQHLGLRGVRVITMQTVGGSKGTRKFIQYVCADNSIEQNQILYIGDGEKDMHETANTAVIFLLASWTNTTLPYGIPINSPLDVLPLIDTYFSKPLPWGYKVDGKDLRGRTVNVRAIFDVSHINNVPAIRKILKDKVDSPLGPWNVSNYLSFHLLASIYEEGIHLEKPYWCLYPSHDGPQIGVLKTFAHYASRLFREHFLSDLLIRGQPVESRYRTRNKSWQSHGMTANPPIEDQFRSVYVNHEYSKKIVNKSVIVLDDFVTSGGSFEVARNYLYEAGARNVYCIAVGKYPKPHKSYCLTIPVNPFTLNIDISEEDMQLQLLENWSSYDNGLKQFLAEQLMHLQKK